MLFVWLVDETVFTVGLDLFVARINTPRRKATVVTKAVIIITERFEVKKVCAELSRLLAQFEQKRESAACKVLQ